MTDKPILQFRDQYRFLSNFWPTQGSTVEHQFQAAKTLDPVEKRMVLEAATPGEAKELGRKVTLREDWDIVKVQTMAELVAWKFTNDLVLQGMLLATGNSPLYEGNTWNDLFWGVDLKTGKGENHLGTILMAVRNTLRFKR